MPAVCRNFGRGTCHFGDGCRYSHGGATSIAAVHYQPYPTFAPPTALKACLDFAKGVCQHGTACRFAHSGPPATYTGGVAKGGRRQRKPNPQQPLMIMGGPQFAAPAPRPCRNFAKGFCQIGAACRFAHGHEAVTPIRFQPYPTPAKQPKALKACRYFAKGVCQQGAACGFAHHGAVGGPAKPPKRLNAPAGGLIAQHFAAAAHQPLMIMAPPQGRKAAVKGAQGSKVCRLFASGSCHNGDACRFAHPGAQSTGQPAVCRQFKRGNCKKGPACQFTHTGGLAIAAPVLMIGYAPAAVVRNPYATK